jgi:hypothetical protein
MRTASKMLEYLVAAEVAVQAMVMVWRIAGLGNVSMAGKTRLLQAVLVPRVWRSDLGRGMADPIESVVHERLFRWPSRV